MAYLKFNSLLLFLFILLAGHLNAAQLLSISGKVDVRRQGSADWVRVKGSARIQAGDAVKTRWRSRVQVLFEDGSRVEIGPSSFYILEEDSAGRVNTSMKLKFGWMKAWVKKLIKRKFSVRTPTAVCAVRGTEFVIEVKGNKTSIDLFKGLLSVGDGKGNEVMLNAGQHLMVDESGLGRAMSMETFRTRTKEESRQMLKREVSLNMTKEQVQAAASEEIRLAEYQQGKSMIDVFGKRVRLEQYIMRPNPDQFKLVVLNDRVDRFDYFYYLGTFNTTLPTDLSVALSQLGGCLGSECNYFLKSYETGRSNLTDTIEETATGGHQVDVNSNAYADDNVSAYFDSELNKYVSWSGKFYKTLFNDYSIKYNGTEFLKWDSQTGGNITSYSDTLAGGINYYYIGDDGQLGAANTGIPDDNSLTDPYPDGDLLHNKIRLTYGTGTYWEQYDNYIVSDEGKTAAFSDFAGVSSGAAYQEEMLKWNFEQVITCNLFGGRKIDLVVEPKTLFQSGLIK